MAVSLQMALDPAIARISGRGEPELLRLTPSRKGDDAMTARSHVGVVVVLLCLAVLEASSVGTPNNTPVPAGLEVQLLMEDETRAAGATVRHSAFPLSPEGGGEWRERVSVADSNGRVCIEGVRPNELGLLFCRSADGTCSVVHHLAQPLEPGAVVLVHLYPPARIVGELRDVEGEPASGVSLHVTSGWPWLCDDQPDQVVHSDELGRFSIPNIIRGSMISVVGHAGALDDPTTTWRFSGRQWSPVDDWYSLGILLPVSNRSYAERPVGVALDTFVSGVAEDRWYDAESRRWRPPVPTFDPGDGWSDPPGDAVTIWHVGRPDRREERFGKTLTFRRSFPVPGDVSEVVGYLTVNADDYAAVYVNGHWVGQCAFWQSSHTFIIPGDYLAAGDNELYFVVRNGPGGGRDYYNPGCLAYMLELIEPGL